MFLNFPQEIHGDLWDPAFHSRLRTPPGTDRAHPASRVPELGLCLGAARQRWEELAEWSGGSDRRSVWGTHFPDIFTISWGAVWSYLEFPNYLVVI